MPSLRDAEHLRRCASDNCARCRCASGKYSAFTWLTSSVHNGHWKVKCKVCNIMLQCKLSHFQRHSASAVHGCNIRGEPILLQLPLVPAYALTVHKTQALSIKHLVLGCVALSFARALLHVILLRRAQKSGGAARETDTWCVIVLLTRVE